MRGLFIPTPNQRREVPNFSKAARLVGLVKTQDELEALDKRKDLDPRVTKAAVVAGTTGNADYSALDSAATVSAEFYAAMQDTSILFALLESGTMIRLPFRARLLWSAAEATAAIRGEGKAARLTAAEIEKAGLEPTDAAAIIAISKELLTSGGPEVENLIDRILRRATAYAADVEFLDQMIDGDTPTIASEAFSGAEDVILDLRSLIEAVEPTEDSRLMFGMNPRVLRDAALLTSTAGGFLFPDLTITGGNIRGIPCVPSAALAAGEIALFDGSGLVGNAGLAKLKSTDATIEMSDAPGQDGSAGTGSTMVSLWQSGLVGIISRVEFAATRLRDSAVVKMTGCDWGGSVNVS